MRQGRVRAAIANKLVTRARRLATSLLLTPLARAITVDSGLLQPAAAPLRCTCSWAAINRRCGFLELLSGGAKLQCIMTPVGKLARLWQWRVCDTLSPRIYPKSACALAILGASDLSRQLQCNCHKIEFGHWQWQNYTRG